MILFVGLYGSLAMVQTEQYVLLRLFERNAMAKYPLDIRLKLGSEEGSKAETLLAKYHAWYDEHRKDNFYMDDVILYLLELLNAEGYQLASFDWQIDPNSRKNEYLILFKKSKEE
ncbi:MAG: hypothetical protein OHK0053_12350 [Microscillaceae bacterium]